MLIEIQCDKFKKGPIEFHEGFNVVLGDENATNSIGKSNLLMIIDFIYGGNSLLEHNKDIVEELGHHDYYTAFRFNEEIYRFRRGTYSPEIVNVCDDQYGVTSTISVEKYTAFLMASYNIEIERLTFRDMVGLYSRIWGKKNLEVYKPLHIIPQKPSKQCVDNLIKTFNHYSSIEELSDQLKIKDEKRIALNKAKKNQLIPKIGKREHNENEKRISRIESEIEDIKTNLAKYATNLSEVVNQQVLELKIDKDTLLDTKIKVEGKLSRIKKNISENRHIKSKHFDGLINFFPELNQNKLAEVEEFHDKVSRLLKNELKESESELELQLSRIEQSIIEIDLKMASTLENVEEPNQIVDRVFELSISLYDAKEKNEHFQVESELRENIKSIKAQLSNEKEKIVKLIQNSINDAIRRIVDKIFDQEKKSPILRLGESNYSFLVFEDTGTGTAYTGLLEFDLAIFQLTSLPFVIHDSILFKNIENDSLSNIFNLYNEIEKQSFIAIDEIQKYGAETESLLKEKSVIQLDNDNVLYIKDWRRV